MRSASPYVWAPCPRCGSQDLGVQMKIQPAESQAAPTYRARCRACRATFAIRLDPDNAE